jgi:hypothetical protein
MRPAVDRATLVAWLERRSEPAPDSLRRRLGDAVAPVDPPRDGTLGSMLVLAGSALLAQLLVDGCGDRTAAPDLLTADALVTYAFEAAADDAAATARGIDAQAAAAMSEVAALGEAP